MVGSCGDILSAAARECPRWTSFAWHATTLRVRVATGGKRSQRSCIQRYDDGWFRLPTPERAREMARARCDPGAELRSTAGTGFPAACDSVAGPGEDAAPSPSGGTSQRDLATTRSRTQSPRRGCIHRRPSARPQRPSPSSPERIDLSIGRPRLAGRRIFHHASACYTRSSPQSPIHPAHFSG